MNRIVSMFIVLIMSATLFTTNSSAAFYDVTSKNPHYQAINWAVDLGILKGYEDGSFKPNGTLTEAQFMRIFARYLNPLVENESINTSDTDAVYDYLKERNVIVSGTSNKQVRAQKFTRLDVAKAFTAYDLGKSKVTSKEAIDWMYANNITSGKGISADKYDDFGSTDPLKRAHIVAFFKRLYDYKVIDVAKYSRDVYKAANDLAPEGYKLSTLEKVNLTKKANGKTTYFAMYLEPGWNSLPYYTLLEYDEATRKWTMPISEMNEGNRYEEIHKVHFADDDSISNEQLLLINWEGTGGFIVVYALGVDEVGNYHLNSYGGYANGSYELDDYSIKLYEGDQLMETLTWFDGELISY